jgi:hypothetical protein
LDGVKVLWAAGVSALFRAAARVYRLYQGALATPRVGGSISPQATTHKSLIYRD